MGSVCIVLCQVSWWRLCSCWVRVPEPETLSKPFLRNITAFRDMVLEDQPMLEVLKSAAESGRIQEFGLQD